jgi:hypothetical protein
MRACKRTSLSYARHLLQGAAELRSLVLLSAPAVPGAAEAALIHCKATLAVMLQLKCTC